MCFIGLLSEVRGSSDVLVCYVSFSSDQRSSEQGLATQFIMTVNLLNNYLTKGRNKTNISLKDFYGELLAKNWWILSHLDI